jgi:hypothetical protein
VTDEEDTADTESGEGESVSSGEENVSGMTQETHTVTMLEYLAENVISVQTLENTPAEGQEETQAKQEEETITIDGVTWQSEPAYAGSTEGTYIFTAVLPEGYALAEGVSLPQITVTVESGTDAIIRALPDRIAALEKLKVWMEIAKTAGESAQVMAAALATAALAEIM